MNPLDSVKELSVRSKSLLLAVLALIIFFVSEVVRLEYYSLYSIFTGGFNLGDVPKLFNYSNFISAISLILLYLGIKNFSKVVNEEQEKYLISLIVTIIVFNYVFKFFFVERLLSLYTFSINSLPDSLTDFFPFNWLDISYGYESIRSGYGADWIKIGFIAALVSAVSILTSMFFALKFLHSRKVKLEVNSGLLFIKSFFKSAKTILAVLSVVLVFSTFGIQNIKNWDYSVITMETGFAQEDLTEFREELKLANLKVFESERVEARKVAANKAYSSISNLEDRLKIDLSLWSNDLEELGSGVVEWIVLWKKLLREMSTQGYSEPETIFDLNQKYLELAKLGSFVAPQLAEDYDIDFWNEEFYALVG